MILRFSLRLLLVTTLFLGVTAWHVPAAHSGAPGAYREAERPPGHAGPHPGATPTHTTGHPACRVCRVAARLGVTMTPRFHPRIHRCPMRPAGVLVVTHPRGVVLASQLTHATFEIHPDAVRDPDADLDALFGADGARHPRLEFRVGASVLGHATIAPPYIAGRIALPAALRERMRGIRGEITVHAEDLPRAEPVAAFWIEAPSHPVRRDLERIDLGLAREPLWLRHVVRAQAWLDAGFVPRALEEARAALALQPLEPHAVSLTTLLQRMLGLAGTDEDRAALERHLALAPRRKAARGTRAPRCRLDAPFPQTLRRRVPPTGGCGRPVGR